MEREGQNLANSTDAKPLLKHVRPIRANYTPRKYKPFEEGEDRDLNDLFACNNANSSKTFKHIGESARIPKQELNPVVKHEHSEEKSVINKLRRKHVAASIHINVEPVESLSQKQLPKRNASSPVTVVVESDENNSGQFPKRQLSRRVGSHESRYVTNPRGTITRPRGRPPGRPRKRVLPPDKAATRLHGKPRKQVKLMVPQCNKQTKSLIADEKGSKVRESSPSSDASVSDTVSEHANTAYQCNICNKRFSNQARLQNHMHWHVKRKMFKCNVCKRIFKGFSCFIQHQQSHGKNKPSKTITKSLQAGASSDSNKMSPTKRARRTFKCPTCSKTFVQLKALKLHSLMHDPNRKKYKCSVCDKIFVIFGRLQQHALRFHGLRDVKKCEVELPNSESEKAFDVSSKLQPDSETGEDSKLSANDKDNQCNICKKTFSFQRTLQRHKRMHSGEKPFKCHVCNKPMMWRHQLYQHCKNVHGVLQPYKCNECGSLFRLALNLHKHKESGCGLSSVSSKSEDALDDDKDKLYKCDECNERFRTPRSLRRHCASHRESKLNVSPQRTLPNGTLRRLSTRLTGVATRSSPKPQDPPSVSPNSDTCIAASESLCCESEMETLEENVHHEKKQSSSTLPLFKPPPSKLSPSKRPLSESTSKSPPSKQPPSKSPPSKPTPSKQPSSELPLSKPPPSKPPPSPPPQSSQTEPDKPQWIKFSRENGQKVYRCGLCKTCDRKFLAVSSVRKHVGAVHRDFTDNLVEPPGLYDDIPSTSTQSNNGASTSSVSGQASSLSQSSSSQNSCTCNGRGKSYVYKNNKLTHLPNNCPVHNKESSESKKISTGNPILRCKHCDKEFDGLAREKFQEHELSHELEATEPTGMTYACFECEVEFSVVNELMEHYEKEH